MQQSSMHVFLLQTFFFLVSQTFCMSRSRSDGIRIEVLNRSNFVFQLKQQEGFHPNKATFFDFYLSTSPALLSVCVCERERGCVCAALFFFPQGKTNTLNHIPAAVDTLTEVALCVAQPLSVTRAGWRRPDNGPPSHVL